MKSVETIKSARKKWSKVRGPIMLLVVTVFLGIVGLKLTETMGVKDASEWLDDYKGLLYGLLLVIGLGAVGAFLLVMLRKVFGSKRRPHDWENFGKKDEDTPDKEENK